eukprot:1193736-Prorocentrum_minimum.AAC.5
MSDMDIASARRICSSSSSSSGLGETPGWGRLSLRVTGYAAGGSGSDGLADEEEDVPSAMFMSDMDMASASRICSSSLSSPSSSSSSSFLMSPRAPMGRVSPGWKP